MEWVLESIANGDYTILNDDRKSIDSGLYIFDSCKLSEHAVIDSLIVRNDNDGKPVNASSKYVFFINCSDEFMRDFPLRQLSEPPLQVFSDRLFDASAYIYPKLQFHNAYNVPPDATICGKYTATELRGIDCPNFYGSILNSEDTDKVEDLTHLERVNISGEHNQKLKFRPIELKCQYCTSIDVSRLKLLEIDNECQLIGNPENAELIVYSVRNFSKEFFRGWKSITVQSEISLEWFKYLNSVTENLSIDQVRISSSDDLSNFEFKPGAVEFMTFPDWRMCQYGNVFIRNPPATMSVPTTNVPTVQQEEISLPKTRLHITHGRKNMAPFLRCLGLFVENQYKIRKHHFTDAALATMTLTDTNINCLRRPIFEKFYSKPLKQGFTIVAQHFEQSILSLIGDFIM